MSNKISIAFRPYATTDINFILSNWLHTWANAPANFGVHKHVYYKTAEAHIKDTLARCGAIVACDPNDPDDLFGFIAAEYMDDETVIHWIHVKPSFRGFGIGRALFKKVHTKDSPPFTTAYCPRYDSVDELYRKGKSRQDMDDLYYRVKKQIIDLPTITLVDEDGRKIGTINKNSMVYSVEKPGLKRDKYPVIYSPLLITRLNNCNTRPIATLVE